MEKKIESEFKAIPSPVQDNLELPKIIPEETIRILLEASGINQGPISPKTLSFDGQSDVYFYAPQEFAKELPVDLFLDDSLHYFFAPGNKNTNRRICYFIKTQKYPLVAIVLELEKLNEKRLKNLERILGEELIDSPRMLKQDPNLKRLKKLYEKVNCLVLGPFDDPSFGTQLQPLFLNAYISKFPFEVKFLKFNPPSVFPWVNVIYRLLQLGINHVDHSMGWPLGTLKKDYRELLALSVSDIFFKLKKELPNEYVVILKHLEILNAKFTLMKYYQLVTPDLTLEELKKLKRAAEDQMAIEEERVGSENHNCQSDLPLNPLSLGAYEALIYETLTQLNIENLCRLWQNRQQPKTLAQIIQSIIFQTEQLCKQSHAQLENKIQDTHQDRIRTLEREPKNSWHRIKNVASWFYRHSFVQLGATLALPATQAVARSVSATYNRVVRTSSLITKVCDRFIKAGHPLIKKSVYRFSEFCKPILEHSLVLALVKIGYFKIKGVLQIPNFLKKDFSRLIEWLQKRVTFQKIITLSGAGLGLGLTYALGLSNGIRLLAVDLLVFSFYPKIKHSISKFMLSLYPKMNRGILTQANFFRVTMICVGILSSIVSQTTRPFLQIILVLVGGASFNQIKQYSTSRANALRRKEQSLWLLNSTKPYHDQSIKHLVGTLSALQRAELWIFQNDYSSLKGLQHPEVKSHDKWSRIFLYHKTLIAQEGAELLKITLPYLETLSLRQSAEYRIFWGLPIDSTIDNTLANAVQHPEFQINYIPPITLLYNAKNSFNIPWKTLTENSMVQKAILLNAPLHESRSPFDNEGQQPIHSEDYARVWL